MNVALLHCRLFLAGIRPLETRISVRLSVGLLALLITLMPQWSAAAQAIDTRPVPAASLKSALPAGWHHGVFMEIFVRAWRDSNGDGIGDLRGLTQSLPYLHKLGVRGLWLMPITANADGDHGYATTDFRNIAPEYGTLADFDAFIQAAHKHGMGVIMDYVINHSAAQHAMFVDARSNPASAFRDWYVWAEEAPQGWDIWGKNPWYLTASEPWNFPGEPKDLPPAPPGSRGFYFGTFGPHMPDFNFRHPPVLQYHLDSLRFWLNRGLDGFRLDAVPHLLEGDAVNWNDQPESRRLTKQLQDLIKTYRHRYVVCEATAEPQAYGDPAVCGGAFAFGHVHHYVKAALGDPASVQQVAAYYRHARPTMATFVSNHDIFAGRRLWDQVGGDNAAYRLAAAGYLLQPGTPFVYYGEEVGQAGVPGLPGDLPLRGPMSWTADSRGFSSAVPFRPMAPNAASHNAQAQQADPQSIWHFYRALIQLRNTRPSLARGSFEHSFASGLVAGWQRRQGAERTLVVMNYGADAATVALPGLPPGALLLPLLALDGAQMLAGPALKDHAQRVSAQGELSAALPPQSLRVWRVVLPRRAGN